MTVTKPSVAPLTADPLQPTASSSRQIARADRAGEPPSGPRFAATLAAATAPRSTAPEPVPARPVPGRSNAQDAGVPDDQGQQALPDPAAATATETLTAAATSAVTVALTVIAPGPAPAATTAGPEVPAAQNLAIGQAEPAATSSPTSRAAATAVAPPTASPSPSHSLSPSPSPSSSPSAGFAETAAAAPSSTIAGRTAGGTVAGGGTPDVDPAPAGTTGPAAGERTDLASGPLPAGPAEQSASGDGSAASTGRPRDQETAPRAMATTAGPASGTATSTATPTGSVATTALTGVGPRHGRGAVTENDPGPTAAAAQPRQPVEPTTPFGTPTGAPTGTPSAQAAASTPSADPAAAPSAPAPPVVDQVTRHLLAARLLRDGTHHTVMHLSPEHLGPVTVTVDVLDGAVRLELVGGSGALGALGHDLDSLRSQLADAGLDLADVTMRADDQTGGPFGRGPGERRPDGGPDRGQAGAAEAGSTDQPIQQPGPITDVSDQNTDQLTPDPAGHRGRLDVRV